MVSSDDHLSLGGGLNDPQLPKTWEVFVSRPYWVHFWPMNRGSRWFLISRGFRICMAKWGRGSKVPGYGRLLSKFDQSFSYSGGLIESCPKPGTFDPLPPFAIHILNPLDMRIHQDPLYIGQICTQKCLEANTSQVFGNCGSLSPPPTYSAMAELTFKLSLSHLCIVKGNLVCPRKSRLHLETKVVFLDALASLKPC